MGAGLSLGLSVLPIWATWYLGLGGGMAICSNNGRTVSWAECCACDGYYGRPGYRTSLDHG